MALIKKIFLIFLFIFLFSSLVRNIFDYQKKITFYQQYEEEVKKETKKKINLQTEILKKTDPYYLEEVIRDKLNLAKPNEKVILLSPPSPTPTQPIKPTPAIWQQWQTVLFNHQPDKIY